MSEPTAPDTRPVCQNCGAPLLGPHCYACGQPVHGLVRRFSTVLGDFLDSVLNIDSRIVHTLWPLFARPGYLSLEYFAGRRVRYVSPVRLFVFLSIVTFFVARMVVPAGDAFRLNDGSDARIGRATTVADVERLRDEALAKLDTAREATPVAGARAGIDAGAKEIRRKAQARIDALREAAAHHEPPPMADETPTIEFDGTPWDAKTHPVNISWWPRFANAWLNREIARAQVNIGRMQQDPSLFKDAALGAIPSTLFILLPLFAVMLKILYVMRRRLYMEHLIVALHSHAFLCLALLLVFLLSALADAAPAVSPVTTALKVGLFVWMPAYLLVMQKRVYGQGWTMTFLKYCMLGFCYLFLLSFGAVMTVLASVVWG